MLEALTSALVAGTDPHVTECPLVSGPGSGASASQPGAWASLLVLVVGRTCAPVGQVRRLVA